MYRPKETTHVCVVLFTSKTLANGEHPLMLRITKDRKRTYKSIGFSCALQYWDTSKNQPKRNHPNKQLLEAFIASKISDYTNSILEFKNDKKEFTSTMLLNKVEKPLRKGTLFSFFTETIERLVSENRIGNSNAYRDTYRSIKNFLKDVDVTFSAIDYSFLQNYETHLRKKGLRETTISIYFRTLRALYKEAIRHNIAKESNYPFKEYKISKFDTSTKPRAISKEEIRRIENLKLDPSSTLFESRHYFLFSYYGAGINFVDMAHLRWSNISNGRIEYKRAKTGDELNFKVLERALEIIEYWKPLSLATQNAYIFPILDQHKHITAAQIDNRIHKVITRVNKDLKEIGAMAGIDATLTTYVARHTFATILKKSGVSTAIISEALGHESESITNVYLKNFENDVMDKAMQHL